MTLQYVRVCSQTLKYLWTVSVFSFIMAGRLLFVFLMYSFHKIQVQALLAPNLTVNPLVITDTDSVTLNCQPPPSVSVSQCYFRTVNGGPAKPFSCLQTLTGTEVLKMSYQSLPAEVEVKCFYLKVSQSPESETSSITIRTSLPPKLTVNPPVINETDSVTLNCQPPPSFTVTQCHFYISSGGTVRDSSCLQTLTGTELLKMSPQSSPAEVEVMCFYTVKLGKKDSPSPYSGTSHITIHNIVEKESRMTQTVPTFTMTTGTRSHASTPVSSEKQTSAIVEKESNSGLTQSAVITTTGSTVSRPHASTPITPAKQTSPNRITGLTVGRPSNTDSFISTSLIPVKPSVTTLMNLASGNITVALTLNTASTKASLFPETSSETWIRKSIIVVAGFGVTVGVISLGLGLFCTKRRTEGCSYKRKQTNVTDDFMYMINLDYEGLFSADNDKANDVITSLPGLECPTGSDKPNRREPQTEDSDIYHVYCTIPDDPPPSALKDMVYSTVQTH